MQSKAATFAEMIWELMKTNANYKRVFRIATVNVFLLLWVSMSVGGIGRNGINLDYLLG